MNVSNGMIVRKTDYQIKQDRDEELRNERIRLEDINIEEFNEKQKLVQEKNMLYRDLEYNYSCDMSK